MNMKVVFILCYLLIAYCWYISQMWWHINRGLIKYFNTSEHIIFSFLWPLLMVGCVIIYFYEHALLPINKLHNKLVINILTKLSDRKLDKTT